MDSAKMRVGFCCHIDDAKLFVRATEPELDGKFLYFDHFIIGFAELHLDEL